MDIDPCASRDFEVAVYNILLRGGFWAIVHDVCARASGGFGNVNQLDMCYYEGCL